MALDNGWKCEQPPGDDPEHPALGRYLAPVEVSASDAQNLWVALTARPALPLLEPTLGLDTWMVRKISEAGGFVIERLTGPYTGRPHSPLEGASPFTI
jgi:hypothetical protein